MMDQMPKGGRKAVDMPMPAPITVRKIARLSLEQEQARAAAALAELKKNEAERATEDAMEARAMGRFEDDGGGQMQGRVAGVAETEAKPKESYLVSEAREWFQGVKEDVAGANLAALDMVDQKLASAGKTYADIGTSAKEMAALRASVAASIAERAQDAKALARMEDDGGQAQGRATETFTPAPAEEGDVPSWDAPKPKKEKRWTLKSGSVEVDMTALGLTPEDVLAWPPKEQVKALAQELDPSGLAAKTPELSQLEEQMPPAQLEAIANAFGEGFGPEAPKAVTEAVQEIAKMPKAKKERTLNGVANLGVFISEWKSDKMAELIGAVETKTDNGSFINNLLKSGREYYERKSANSRKLIEDKTKLASLAGAMTGVSKMGSILSWGRVALDIVGKGAFAKHLNPFRHATAAAMAFGAGAEIAKEARFKAQGLKEKTRVQDWEDVEAEARALYEDAKAKAKGGEVTADMLSATYQERLPQDLLARLDNNIMAGSTFVGHILKKDLAWGVARIQKKLEGIEGNKKLTTEQKEAKRQELLASYSGFLRDADLMTTRVAGVDAAAYASRLVEKGAKAFVTVMAVDTVARLFTSAHDIFDRNFGSLGATGAVASRVETPAHVGGESLAPESAPVAPLVDAEVMTAESRDLPPGIVSMETIGAGGSITGSLMKQLEEHPEKFGYTGNPRSSEELHAWAFRSAKQMAKSAGFLTRKDQQDTWLSAAAVGKLHIGVDMSHGKPELAMVDPDGHVMTSAELKAGPYTMKTPFVDRGEPPDAITPEPTPTPTTEPEREEEKPPAPPVPKPPRRPVVAPVEPEPVPTPKPEVPTFVLDGVEHPEWVKAYAEVITPEFNKLPGDDSQLGKEALLSFLNDIHEAKKMIEAMSAEGRAIPDETRELIEGQKELAMQLYRGVLKPDWFEKV